MKIKRTNSNSRKNLFQNFFAGNYTFFIGLIFFSVSAGTMAAPPAAIGPPSFAHSPVDIALSSNGRSAISVVIDLTVVSQGHQQLNFILPNRAAVNLTREYFEDRGNGNAVWRGQLANGNAVLTTHSGYMFGRIQIDVDVYEIRPGKGKNHIIEQLDMGSFPHEHADPIHAPLVMPADKTDASTSSDTTATAAAIGTVEIDLMSVYSFEGRNEVGGTPQMEALIQSAVDNANAAFANSDMTLVYRLVHTAEINHTESDDLGTELVWLRNDPTVAALRNQYGADMVGMVSKRNSTYCGIGYLTTSASYAFQVTSHNCAVGNLTYAHEHGHNLTMEHDPANANANASYEWSYAHFVEDSFRTVMSYWNQCRSYSSCPEITNFSNPDISHNGEPTGTSFRDNARTGDLQGVAASNYRDAVAINTTASNDSYSTPINTPVSGNVLNNDSDPEGDTLTVISNTPPLNGGAVASLVPDGNFTYSPDTNFSGNDSFTYTISDGNGNENSATVTITIAPNGLPVAVDDNYTTEINTAVSGNVLSNDSDPDGDVLIATFHSQPGKGSLAIYENGDITYTPDNGSIGTDTFSYTIDDSNGGTDEGEVSITVTDSSTLPPEAPSNLSINVTSTGKGKRRTVTGATLSWNDNSDNESEFIIEWCDVTESGKGRNKTTTCDSSGSDSTAESISTYLLPPEHLNLDKDRRYQVRSINTNGNSEPSNQVNL